MNRTSKPPAADLGDTAAGAKVGEGRQGGAPVTPPASGPTAGPGGGGEASPGPAPTVTAGPHDLTHLQLKVLLTAIHADRVQRHRGNSHLEAWDVRRTLTRIFGFGGWSDQTLELACIQDAKTRVDGEFRWWVAYRAQVRLIVRTRDGRTLGWWDDTAVGDAQKQVSAGAAHDLAAKSALSQALKRCAANLGDQLGLSLYRDGDLSPVVIWSAAHPPEGDEVDTTTVGPGATDPDAALVEEILARVRGAATAAQLNRLWARVEREEQEGLPAELAEQLRDAMHQRFAALPGDQSPGAVAAAQDAAEQPDTH